MKLKNYIEFLNENIEDYDEPYITLKKIIKDKAPFITDMMVNDKEGTLRRLKFDKLELIDELPNDDLFINIRMKIDVPVNKTVLYWLMKKFVDNPTISNVKIKDDALYKFYIASFKIKDLINDQLKSKFGIEKFNL